jgi:hypothetical protein
MKNKSILVLIIIAFAGCCLFGCNKTEEEPYVRFDQIFNINSTLSGFSAAEQVFTLPAGETLYYTGTTAKDYSNSYIPSMDIFIVVKSGLYGVYNAETGVQIVPYNYASYKVSYGYILMTASDGSSDLYNANGDVVVSATSASYIAPISKNYIAVRYTSGFCNIYNKDGIIVNTEGGSPISIKALPSELKEADGYIIKTTETNSITEISVYNIETSVWLSKGAFEATTSNYSATIFYLGNHINNCCDYTDSATIDEYDFKNLADDYCILNSWYYNASADTRTYLDDTFFYSTMFNCYYAEEAADVLEINSYLKEGYTYVSVALIVDSEKKTSTYDQYIIDSNGKMIVSMQNALGNNVTYSASKNDYRDVLLTYIGDYGFSSATKGDLKIYDRFGNLILTKTDATYSEVFVNNGIITALKTEKGATTGYMVAYDIQGNEIISASRKYSALTPFVGGYAFAQYTNTSGVLTLVRVDVEGVPESPSVVQIKNTSGKITGYFYKTGAYLFKDSGTSKYGVSSFDDTILVEASADNAVISKYGLNTVFFTTIVGGVYTVYRLV